MSRRIVSLTIPGEPYAQKRARHTKRGITYDPKENRDWRVRAQAYMREAMKGEPPLEGPLELLVCAYFTMPKSRHLKREPRPGEWHTKKPDIKNVLTAIEDAGTGILWLDDAQLCKEGLLKWTQQQGTPGSTLIEVKKLELPRASSVVPFGIGGRPW